MQRFPVATTAAAAAALFAGYASAVAQTPSAPPAQAAASPISADQYLTMASASDLYEIQSSQMVQGSADAAVNDFAAMMIEHHTKTTRELTQAAGKAGLTPPPPALDANKAAMIEALRAAPKDQRTALYVEQQVAAHQEALALHSGYAASGDNPELRAVAKKTAGIVREHLTRIQQIHHTQAR